MQTKRLLREHGIPYDEINVETYVPDMLNAMVTLVGAALKCGLTRVGSVQPSLLGHLPSSEQLASGETSADDESLAHAREKARKPTQHASSVSMPSRSRVLMNPLSR
jgi:hypothetical protein